MVKGSSRRRRQVRAADVTRGSESSIERAGDVLERSLASGGERRLGVADAVHQKRGRSCSGDPLQASAVRIGAGEHVHAEASRCDTASRRRALRRDRRPSRRCDHPRLRARCAQERERELRQMEHRGAGSAKVCPSLDRRLPEMLQRIDAEVVHKRSARDSGRSDETSAIIDSRPRAPPDPPRPTRRHRRSTPRARAFGV